MPRRLIISDHAWERMAEQQVTEQEVRATFHRPDATGSSQQLGRSLRSRVIDGRLITLVMEEGTTPAEVVTVWTDDDSA